MIRWLSRAASALALAMLACHAPAFAATFADFVEFGALGLGPGTTGSLSVFDSDPPQWLHDITDSLGGVPAGLLITDATVSLAFSGTDGSEAWNIVADGVNLGTLSVSSSVITQPFALPPAALMALAADGQLQLVLTESTSSRDGIRLFEATLAGTYELPAQQNQPPVGAQADPVSTPELPSGMLMAPMLLGLLIGRMRKREAVER